MSDFTPFEKKTSDIKTSLAQVAKDQRLPITKIDFELLATHTHIQTRDSKEWVEHNGDSLLESLGEDMLRDSDLKIEQIHEIIIRPFKPHSYLDLQFNIATDNKKSRIIAVIHPSSTIPMKKGVNGWIKEQINNKRLRLGFVLSIFDFDLEKEINRMLGFIQKNGKLTSSYLLPISQCLPPVHGSDDMIIFHYKDLNIDNSLIEAVQPGSLILEYVFHKQGKNGRGRDGAYISAGEPTVKFLDHIRFDEDSVSAIHGDDGILYYAKKEGFVRYEGGVYSVANALLLESVSAKTTGSINVGADKEILLSVAQNNPQLDAIGSGVKLDIQTINISGTVGGNSSIQASNVSIGAQTHKKSNIHATEVANINLHRGNLKAKEANIGIIEGGKIEVINAHVGKMLGGEVIAHNIYIDTVYSNVRLIALNSITIGNIIGNGNSFMIDPIAIPSYNEQVSSLSISIQENELLIEENEDEVAHLKRVLLEMENHTNEIKDRVVLIRSENKRPSKFDVDTLKNYRKMYDDLKMKQSQANERKVHTQRLKDRLEKLFEIDLHAFITCTSGYNGETRIVFKDPRTRQELIAVPPCDITMIRLEKNEDEKIMQLLK